MTEISKIYPTVNVHSDKEHVLVIMGGMSNEYEISHMTGEGVVKSLTHLGYKVTAIDMGRDIAKIIYETKPDIIYNALHGGYGEDGSLAGLLEIINIPYTHSGVFASAVGMDKIASKLLFAANGIKTADYIIINKFDELLSEPMARPYVIKPINEGSSKGINVVFAGDNFDIRDYDFKYGDNVMIERYIKGKEIQVAIVDNKAIGTLEVVPKGRFYDYDAKYNAELAAAHITPAPISKEANDRVLELGLKAHKILQCRGVTRVEFLYNEEEDEFYILEVNTHPGMTPLSIVPDIANYMGIDYNNLVEIIIKDALENKKIQ